MFSAFTVLAAAPECSITKDCNQSQYNNGVFLFLFFLFLIVRLESVLVQFMACLTRFQIQTLFMDPVGFKKIKKKKSFSLSFILNNACSFSVTEELRSEALIPMLNVGDFSHSLLHVVFFFCFVFFKYPVECVFFYFF